MVNNTVFNNRTGAIIHGADRYQFYVETTCPQNDYIANNILYDNTYNGSPDNNIWLVGDCKGTGHITKNNLIGINPKFVNYIRTGGGNYHLTSTSPAINAGIASNAPSTDYDGVSRPQGSAYDIGAYEYRQ